MARESIIYGDAEKTISSAWPIDVPRAGLFKMKTRGFGPWAPVRVWVEDGLRDPETWDLLSDQTYKAEWAPRTDTDRFYPLSYWRNMNRLYAITKEEFEWLLILRRMPFQSQLPKQW